MAARAAGGMPRVCLLPNVQGVGGMVSFQARLSAGLRQRGIQVSGDARDGDFQAVLITGGTSDLPAILRLRRRGARIVQRLDGINWLHRRLPTGRRHFLRAEYGNRLLALLRARLVSHIVYQSEFVRGWWRDWFGAEHVASTIIHNGVDLAVYSPEGPQERPQGLFRLLLVEGSLQGGYETGLETALALGEGLAARFPLELMVAGRVAPDLQAASQARSRVPIRWAGLVPREAIPTLDRSAHLLFSADLNAACPNAVIEALACGLPVAAFATGALPELVSGDAGRLAPYGADPWTLERPDLPGLVQAAGELLEDQPRFRLSARRKAEQSFSLERMLDRYQQILLD